MRRVEWGEVEGTRIKLASFGPTDMQMVQICDLGGRTDLFRRKFFFTPAFRVTRRDITRFRNLQRLVRWLNQRAYQQTSPV